ncbi:MAG: sterol desaturase family protein [Alphaproteobacteria bacterium]
MRSPSDSVPLPVTPGATRRPIVDVVPGAQVRRRERRLAWTTIAIILALGTATTILVLAGRLRVATGPAGAVRIALECAAWLAVVELYLYGLHRLMHGRWLFRSVHRFHHLSAATDAWTALSLHPVEAIAAFGIFPALVAVHPVHVVTIAAVSAFMITALIATHVNHEPVPRRWHESPATSWLTTPLVHVAHHADARVNFGAATTLPDRIFGTFRVDLSWYDRGRPSSWRESGTGGSGRA